MVNISRNAGSSRFVCGKVTFPPLPVSKMVKIDCPGKDNSMSLIDYICNSLRRRAVKG